MNTTPTTTSIAAAGTSPAKDRLVTGLFPDRASAESAYSAANDRGYEPKDIDLVMSDDTRQRHFGESSVETELGNKAAEGAGIGGAIGGTVGAIAAAVAAVGTSLVLPGLGLIIAGPLAAAAAGAGAGAAGGGLIGALIGWNMPEERVKQYEEGVRNGGILMGLRAKNDEDAAHFERSWAAADGQNVAR
ncbi:hypothetical protein PV762_05920 [Mitsuaria sp. CC2]|uniref:hypothetical protein n=1 Tax=Mitsuaria sp. CC2 TaxID=3029186 RepID=UPI003B8BFEC9